MNKFYLFNLKILLFLYTYILRANAELCPPLFGEFECPIDYNCVFGVCKNEIEQSPSQNCLEVSVQFAFFNSCI